MEIKRNPKDSLVKIGNVPLGNIFTIPDGINGTLYLRVEFATINLTTFEVTHITSLRTDSCAQVLKATLTVEG